MPDRVCDPIDLVTHGLRSLGAVTIMVTGNSMMPTLVRGSRVLVEAIDTDTIQAGDVVAFRREGQLVVHRVHQRCTDFLVTAGDGLGLFDPPVPLAAVVGIVRGLGPRPAPERWVTGARAASVDRVAAWLIADVQSAGDRLMRPPGWQTFRRRRHGIGVDDLVLREIVDAVKDKPTIGVSEHAVDHAWSVLPERLPLDTQILIGCPFGRLDEPMLGNLLPPGLADIHVRVGDPGACVPPVQALTMLATRFSRTPARSEP